MDNQTLVTKIGEMFKDGLYNGFRFFLPYFIKYFLPLIISAAVLGVVWLIYKKLRIYFLTVSGFSKREIRAKLRNDKLWFDFITDISDLFKKK